MKRFSRASLNAWMILTVLVILSLVAIYLRNGMAGINLFIQQWPLSNLAVMLASTAWTWLAFGAILFLLDREKINAQNALTYAGLFLILFVYLNVLRERFRYGDYQYYLEAATSLLQGQPLPDTYIYLPLWAALIQFIAPLGDQGVFIILWNLNIFLLIGFYLLLHRLLERYGFSVRLAASVTTLFLLVNTPLHRTLGYVQVNLLVMVLVIASVTLFPKRIFLSALLLALAVHLKTSPVILVFAFLLERNWRWLAWFTASFILIGLFPIATNGVSPYSDFIANTIALSRNANINFHDTSFDSFLRFFMPFFGVDDFWTRVLTYLSKLLLGVAVLYAAIRNVRNRIPLDDKNAVTLNAIPPLFILMTLASPIVWDHHGIFVTIPFLLLLAILESPIEWTWFAFAYFLEFIQPSFDFFPWSFGRLVAPLIVLALISFSKQKPSRLFNSINDWIVQL